jgi:hypothetical protein
MSKGRTKTHNYVLVVLFEIDRGIMKKMDFDGVFHYQTKVFYIGTSIRVISRPGIRWAMRLIMKQ